MSVTSRVCGVLVCALCVQVFVPSPATGMRLGKHSSQQALPLVQQAALLLDDARSMVEDAAVPERSVSRSVGLVEEAARTARAAAGLARAALLAGEDPTRVQTLRRQARAFEEALQLVYETRYIADVANKITDLQVRIASLRPECGIPEFSADWHFNFGQIDRRLGELRRGEGNLESIRAAIDGHVEALYVSVEQHESLSVELCSRYDEHQESFREVARREALAILRGRELYRVVRDFENQERSSRTAVTDRCTEYQGYLRILPPPTPGSRDSLGVSTAYGSHYPNAAVAFIREHLTVVDDLVESVMPDPSRVSKRVVRNESRFPCFDLAFLITTVVEDVVGGRNYRVAHQYVKIEHGYYLGENTVRGDPVELYLTGIIDAINQHAVDVASAGAGRALVHRYEAEYAVRFRRLEWIGARLAQDTKVTRLLAGDIHGGDRNYLLTLMAQHTIAYDAQQRLEDRIDADISIARETNETRIRQAKITADAQIKIARIETEAALEVARERSRASRFAAVVGGISNIVGRVAQRVPTS